MSGVLLLGFVSVGSTDRFTTRSWIRSASGMRAPIWRALRNFTNASVAPLVSLVASAGDVPDPVIFITGDAPPIAAGTGAAVTGSFPASRSACLTRPCSFNAAMTASLVASAA